MVAVHGTDTATYQVHLPWTPHQIVDALSGRVVARDTAGFAVKIAPPDTKVYLLK